jgi:hypothetical protein
MDMPDQSGMKVQFTAGRFALSAAVAVFLLWLAFELDGTRIGRYAWKGLGIGWFLVQTVRGRPFTAENRMETVLLTASLDFALMWVFVYCVWMGFDKFVRVNSKRRNA